MDGLKEIRTALGQEIKAAEKRTQALQKALENVNKMAGKPSQSPAQLTALARSLLKIDGQDQDMALAAPPAKQAGKRGRPAKAAKGIAAPAKKAGKPGRPAKNAKGSATPAQAAAEIGDQPKRRGRPPKNAAQTEAAAPAQAVAQTGDQPKRRGRPPKNAAQTETAAPTQAVAQTGDQPKRRGRPPKNAAQTEATAPTQAVAQTGDQPKRRGRPPKNAAQTEATAPTQAVAQTGDQPKRRGRPPKNAAQTQAVAKADGARGRGRPRKNAAPETTQDAPAVEANTSAPSDLPKTDEKFWLKLIGNKPIGFDDLQAAAEQKLGIQEASEETRKRLHQRMVFTVRELRANHKVKPIGQGNNMTFVSAGS